jgi:hypothetical protein
MLSLGAYQLLLDFVEPASPEGVIQRCGAGREAAAALVAEFERCELLSTARPNRNETLSQVLAPDVFATPEVVAEISRQLVRGRAVVIRDAFCRAFAEGMHETLAACTSWTIQEGGEPMFHFRHHNLYDDASFPPLLTECKRRFASADARRLATALSQSPCDGTLQFGASLYLPGDFSLPHTDCARGRRVAFIWHLTKEWDDAWGGNLVWCPSGTQLAPRFNVLTLFCVSSASLHFVAPVAPQSRGLRLTVNGWWTAPEERPYREELRVLASGMTPPAYGPAHEPIGPSGRLTAI